VEIASPDAALAVNGGMDSTRLSELDLNLLVVLDVVLAERSVTRAARRLGLTQPAVSNSLARLRTALGDPLLVRTGEGMVPTPRAVALQRRLGTALDGLREAIADPGAFDPRTARRTFVIAATDYVQLVLLGALVRAIRHEAPGVALQIIAPVKAFPWNELGAGAVDLVIGGANAREVPPGVRRRWIFRDTVVCILRAGHPLGREPLTLDRYVDLDHVEALPIGTIGLADAVLARLGRQRRLVLTVPNFLAAPFVVAQSDCCFTLAKRIAAPLAKALPLQVHALPFDTPPVTIGAFWHDRVHADPAHLWLRRLLARTAARIAP
jgi:DNA-binding transcriptional LysR family regulator